jgi:hypothetical protein
MRRTFAIAVVLAVLGLGPGVAEADCPKDLKKRSPDQVVAALRAALAAGDWEAVGCQYAPRAFLADDQGVLVGVDEIVSSLMSLDALFGGVQPVIREDTYFHDMARILWTLDAGWIVIPDGVDTYVIKKGRIEMQSRHGLIEFTGPPPE